MRALEDASERAGVPRHQLLEHAGLEVARRAERLTGGARGPTVLALIGEDKNGADALVACGYLARSRGWGVRLCLTQSRALKRAKVVQEQGWGDGGADGEVCDQVRVQQGQFRIAIDVPSGVDADTGGADPVAFQASLTLATGPAQARNERLSIMAGDGGGDGSLNSTSESRAKSVWSWAARLRMTVECGERCPPRLRTYFPRGRTSHPKETFGRVLIAGGSGRYPCAPVLAALGVLARNERMK